jgi:hypothetical protein
MATTLGQWPLTFSSQRTRGIITSQLVHLSYNLVSGIITIWIPNQDNGIFGKYDSNKNQGYRLISGLKGNPVEAMDACWRQWLYLWYGSLP